MVKRILAPCLGHQSISALVCVCLLGSPGYPSANAGGRPARASIELQDDARILHALNRFTFGPRPHDLEAVRAMGLDRWFDQQLHPAGISNADLDARLAAFPAMLWSSEDLIRRFPSNAVIRQALDGRIDAPDRGILHAVYQDAMYRMA